jgi:beta-N-acetylhexosaminidase
MTLRQKVAQLVWPSVFGDYVSGDSPQWRRLTQYVQQESVGGFTISVGSPIEVAAKLNALQSMSKVPLLFGADLEAGAGFRARGGYFVPNAIDLGGAIVFPPEMALGATRDTTLAYEEGRLTALEGRALGIHIAYAPVLDVNNNPANPVINTRSYSEDPVLAARMGVAFIHGLQDHGMIATGKHFPGHGDTSEDSHLALPTVTAPLERLQAVELPPFRQAIRHGVASLMTAHVMYPAWDPMLPATLSPKVVTGLLREQLRFTGVVLTDDLEMHAIIDHYGIADAAVRSIHAGADILLICKERDREVAAMEAVYAAVQDGTISEWRLEASLTRIRLLKERYLSSSAAADPVVARRIVGQSSHTAVLETILQGAKPSVSVKAPV